MSLDLRRLFDRDPRPDPCAPGTEVVVRDDLLLWHRPTATRSPWASGVLRYRWSAAEADEGISEVLRFFAERGTGFSWHVPDDGEPPNLGERLAARGFHLEAETDLLVAELPITGLRTNPEIEVRAVGDERTLRDSVVVQQPDWDEERRRALIDERRAYVACPGHQGHFAVAYIRDEPIAAARWRFDARRPAIGLTGAETLPEHRNRGAYSTLVAYRGDRGIERGCRWATILADVTTSAPILRKRGFRAVGSARIYLWVAERSSSS